MAGLQLALFLCRSEGQAQLYPSEHSSMVLCQLNREFSIRCKTVTSHQVDPVAKGYWNVAGSINNPNGMGPYLQAVEPYLAKCGAHFLCRDLNTDVREGNPGHLTVIIEFESVAAAIAAYEAPEYQEMIKLRQPHSDVFLSIIEEGDHAGH